jgi:sugar lactone lactonase YvrE
MRSGTFGVVGFHFNKQRTSFGPLPVTLFGALVLAMVIAIASAADEGAMKLEQPVRISARTVDGDILRGYIVSFDTDGFDLQDAKGEQHKIAWTDLDARTVYRLHNDLLPRDDAAAWFALGERLLTQWEDSQPLAKLAFNRAISLDRELAKRIESVKARAAEQRAKLAAEREQVRRAEEAKAFSHESVTLDRPIRVFLPTVDGEHHVGQIIAYSADGVDLKITSQAEADHIKWTDLAAKDAWDTLNKLLPRDNAEAWFLAGQMLTKLDRGERFGEIAFKRAKQANPKVASRIEQFKQARADAIAQAEAAAEAKRRAERAAWFSEKTIELEMPVRINVQNSDGEPVIGQATAYNDVAVTLKLDSGESTDVEWSQFDAETAYQVIEQVLTHPTGEAWLNVARKLYMFEDGEPIAERAFRQALRHDRSLGQRVNEAKDQLAQAKADAAKLAAARKAKENQVWDAGKQGRFVVSLCEDLQGNIWVGTEDEGVWRYDPHEEDKAKRWTQFTRRSTGGPPEEHGPTLTTGTPAENALGDDYAYALACDRLGRIWVGHLNHGVSVYNGEAWRNYDVLSGPLGERVFDIATCPTDGDVWIATDAGLTRYSVDNDEWSYITRADGLPEDQIQCLAFAEDGTIYVGTQCHGLAIATPAQDGQYTDWRYVTAPRGFGDGGRYPIPLTPYGRGLPTDLINDIHVASDGTVWVATTTGLAFSRNQGRSWMYLRGEDWAEKVRGTAGSPHPVTSRMPPMLLAADYVTSVTESPDGDVWVGFRQKRVEILSADLRRKQSLTAKQFSGAELGKDQDYVEAVLTAASGAVWVGWYGAGLTAPQQAGSDASSPEPMGTKIDTTTQRFPSVRHVSVQQLQAILSTSAPEPAQAISVRSSNKPDGGGRLLLPDWKTQGTWTSRYGTTMGVCAAMAAPYDHVSGPRSPWFHYEVRIGEHAGDNDSTRYWVHWLSTTNPRALINKVNGGRRQSSWDDHGEAYPLPHEGPHLYINLKTPPGVWRVSLYFFNKDGHAGMNRVRDYEISIRDFSKSDARFQASREYARARVRDFWGGVWKRFELEGGRSYTIKIDDNWSFNTICSGIFIDAIEDPAAPAPRKRYFGFRDAQGHVQLIDPREIDITQLSEPVNPWLNALDLLEADSSPVSEAKHRLVYATVADRLRKELEHPTDTLEQVRYAIEIRQAMIKCFENLNEYTQRDRLKQEVESLWPLAR